MTHRSPTCRTLAVVTWCAAATAAMACTWDPPARTGTSGAGVGGHRSGTGSGGTGVAVTNPPTNTGDRCIFSDPDRIDCGGKLYSGQGITPDIYVVFDVSGSMATKDDGTNERIDQVRGALGAFLNDPASAGIGVGIGYFGSFVAIGLGFLTSDTLWRFTWVAISFLVFALPCFLFVRERGNPAPRQVFSWRVIRESTSQTLATLRSSREFPGLARFLLGRIFYTDAINTVIAFMGLYVVNVAVASGRDEATAKSLVMFVMAPAIAFAVVGGFIWGHWVDRIGPRRTLDRVLWLWVATFLLAAAVGLFNLPIAALYVVGVMAGVALGGVWSADRPLMLRLTPPDRIGEFYGLYGMVGRFSAIAGPFIWANVARVATGSFGLAPARAQGLNILVLLVFIVIARWIIAPVTDTPRDWSKSPTADRDMPG